MTFAMAIKLLILLSVAGMVFGLALRARLVDALALFRDWRAGLRVFAAMYVAVPAAAIVLVLLIDPPTPVKIAMVALSFSPVPPILPKKQVKAGGGTSYVTGLLVLATATSLIAAPIGIALASLIFGIDASVGFTTALPILLMTIGAPLAVGLLAQRLFGEKAAAVGSKIGAVAMIMLAIGVLALLASLATAMWSLVGDGTVLAALAMIGAGLAAGYALAGPSPSDKTALALAAASRHPGAALAITAVAFPDEHLASAAIWLFTLISTVVSLPLLRRFAQLPSGGDNGHP